MSSKTPRDVKREHQGACFSPGCCGPIGRRQFLKTAGLGAVSLSSLGASVPVVAGPLSLEETEVRHFVPADKKLASSWVRSLSQKGETKVYRGKEIGTIGMPVGGIACGQLYLRGDGTLAEWQIFNRHHFSGYGATNYRYRTPASSVGQGFALLVADGQDKVSAHRLDRDGFPGVEFTGEYPVARVRYAKPGLEVNVELEAFSPFIPLNAEDSALPATLFHFTVENTSARRLRAGILGWLENPVCFHSAHEGGSRDGRRVNRVFNEKGRTLLDFGAEEAPPQEQREVRPAVLLADFEGKDYGDWKVSGEAFGSRPARGTLAGQQRVSGFLGKGLVNTFLGGDGPHGTLTSPAFKITRRFINFLLGGGGHAGETCIQLVVDGKRVRTAAGKSKERLEWRSWNLTDLEGKEARIEIVDRHSGGWGHINVDHIELADERRHGPSGPVDKLEDYGNLVLALKESASNASTVPSLPGRPAGGTETARYSWAESRKGSLEKTVEVGPGEKRTFVFALAWHFPNHQRGHEYANRFKSAREVAHYVLDNHDRLARETRRWHETFYRRSSLPHWLLERIHSTVCNLATGTAQWWQNGRFWAWEGVGCCHGTCTHVWNYAHAAARLFPALERSAREMQDLGEALHPDGLVGFRGERNGHYAADGQAGTVLKCYREHQMSVDDSFLKRNWPKIKRVLEYSIRRDGNADGLIEDSQHNTYDINFHGPNTFVGSLYLAALRAGEEMAREVGDAEFADRVRKIFANGSRQSVERLWNGEYFVQRVDLEKHARFQYGEGCLSDQLFGQGWAHQLALGHVYPREQVQTTLQSIWKYNWTPDVGPQNASYKPERWFARPGEAGLFTCTWPKTRYLDQGVRYRNEVWTGIEYQVAGHMIWEGMLTEALAIMRGIHERYDATKHNPFNEIECGDHYARALASWGCFTALAGYEHHGPRGHLGFAPRLTPESFESAFTAAGGWGSFFQERKEGYQTDRITLRWGKLRLKTLAFALPEQIRDAPVRVAAAGKLLRHTHSMRDQRLEISLAEELQLGEGQTLEVTVG